jgi:hypothetical protein
VESTSLIYPQTRYLICLTIGPAFLSASIYLCLSRIVHIYSASTSRIRPKYYTYVFISCDLVSLILQGAGGGIAATAASGDQSQINLGTNIMIGGLSFQVFSLLLFMILCVDFALRIRKVPEPQRNEEYQALRRTRLFKGFLLGMLIKFWVIFTQTSLLIHSPRNRYWYCHHFHLHSVLLSSGGARVWFRWSIGKQ